MKEPYSIFGRMGNQLFQMAALYAYAKEVNNGDWYFTDLKWFKKYERDIRVLFGDGIINEGMIDAVAVHVRIGDFAREPQSLFHGQLWKTGYYEEAVKLFPGSKFMVFCANGDPENDKKDQDWCREYFKNLGVSFEIANTGDGIKDLNLMARCRHQIIANSSFSWWAAYLNPNPDKIVVAADETKWCQDGIARIKIPEQWKQIRL